MGGYIHTWINDVMHDERIEYTIRYTMVDSTLIETNIEPNRVRVEKLNMVNGFFIKLEKSMLEEGIRNPVILTAQQGKLINRYGGSRVMIAQKHNLIVPAIVADFENRFPDGEILIGEKQIREKFTDKPRKILIKHYGINVSGCDHYHLRDDRKKNGK